MSNATRSFSFTCDYCRSLKENEPIIELKITVKGFITDDVILRKDLCGNCYENFFKELELEK